MLNSIDPSSTTSPARIPLTRPCCTSVSLPLPFPPLSVPLPFCVPIPFVPVIPSAIRRTPPPTAAAAPRARATVLDTFPFPTCPPSSGTSAVSGVSGRIILCGRPGLDWELHRQVQTLAGRRRGWGRAVSGISSSTAPAVACLVAVWAAVGAVRPLIPPAATLPLPTAVPAWVSCGLGCRWGRLCRHSIRKPSGGRRRRRRPCRRICRGDLAAELVRCGHSHLHLV